LQVSKKNVGGLSVSGKGLYIDDQNCPHLVNLNEDPLMTECLVYFLAPGQTVVGSDVNDEDLKCDNKHSISLVGQTIAPQHCEFDNSDGHVYIAPVMGAVTFVNGRRISERTLLHQGNRIVVGNSHIFRFNDPTEAARVRKEREEYLKSHPNESLTAPAVIDWSYAIDELRTMSALEVLNSSSLHHNRPTHGSTSLPGSFKTGKRGTREPSPASPASTETSRHRKREEAWSGHSVADISASRTSTATNASQATTMEAGHVAADSLASKRESGGSDKSGGDGRGLEEGDMVADQRLGNPRGKASATRRSSLEGTQSQKSVP
jgi:predicted component of type VI protein secretion system